MLDAAAGVLGFEAMRDAGLLLFRGGKWDDISIGLSIGIRDAYFVELVRDPALIAHFK